MPFPKIENCVVCEGARLEAFGKYTLLGFYGLAPFISIAFADPIKPLALCFGFIGRPGSGAGNYRVGARVTAPSGKSCDAAPFIDAQLGPGNRVSIFYLLVPGISPETGEHRVELLVDGQVHFPTAIRLEHVSKEELAKLK
jgi:hypothetical protein